MNDAVELPGGTTNKILLDPSSGIVTKRFEYGNGIGLSHTLRINSERESLQRVPHAPVYKGHTPTTISMSYIDGEKRLDCAVFTYPESVQQKVFYKSGEVLSEIHKVLRRPVNDYDKNHWKKVSRLLLINQDNLRQKGISALGLLHGLEETYDSHEIERQGLVWKHGDYWLNNIIGRRTDGRYSIDGVIDWELAGLGSPYEDFAIVRMSIEDPHPDATVPFWKGYGSKPLDKMKDHFAVVKTLEWMTAENELTSGNFDSTFYRPKIQLMKNIL